MTKIIIYAEKNLSTKCVHENGSEVKTTAPKDNQGAGDLFSPTDLFVTSLGSCMVTLMEMVAKKKNLDLSSMRVEVEKEMFLNPRRIGRIVLHFYCKEVFDADIQAELEKAAKTCPVHQSLHPDILQEISFHWGKG